MADYGDSPRGADELRREGTRIGSQDQTTYTVDDMRALYRRGDWTDWDGPLRWLDEHDGGDAELSPETVRTMRESLDRVRERDVLFTPDPDRAFEIAAEVSYLAGSPAGSGERGDQEPPSMTSGSPSPER